VYLLSHRWPSPTHSVDAELKDNDDDNDDDDDDDDNLPPCVVVVVVVVYVVVLLSHSFSLFLVSMHLQYLPTATCCL